MSAESYPEPMPEAPEDQLMGSVGESYRTDEFIKQEKEPLASSAEAERRMISSFYGYCKTKEINLNPKSQLEQQRLTEGAHDFISSAVERKILHDKSEKPGETPFVIDAPRPQIKKIYDNYYREFEEAKIKSGGPIKDKQLAFLTDSLNFAATYNISDEGKVIRRSRKARYAAVNIALKLEDLLRDEGEVDAADSVEVLIAAYGQRFNSLLNGLGHVAFDSHRTTGGVVTRFNIPNDQKAENEIIY